MIERKRENIQVMKKAPLYEKFFKVNEYLLKFPLYNGEMSSLISREVMERGKAAGVLLYDPDMERLVFVEQIRAGAFAAGEYPWLLECVAGMIDSGETPQEVAVREAKEEAGADVSDIEPIAEYFSSPGGCSEKLFLFCGRVDSKRVASYAGLSSENEDIRVVVLSVEETEKMLAQGKFNTALSIIAVQWFLMNKENLRKKWGMS